jgi:hypothetical protein
MRVVLLTAVAAAAALLAFRLIRRRGGHNSITSLRLAATARVTSLLDQNLALEQTLPDALRLLTPQFADWCTVHIVEEHSVRRAAIVHTNRETEQKLADVLNRQPFRLDTPNRSGTSDSDGRARADARRRARRVSIAPASGARDSVDGWPPVVADRAAQSRGAHARIPDARQGDEQRLRCGRSRVGAGPGESNRRCDRPRPVERNVARGFSRAADHTVTPKSAFID